MGSTILVILSVISVLFFFFFFNNCNIYQIIVKCGVASLQHLAKYLQLLTKLRPSFNSVFVDPGT